MTSFLGPVMDCWGTWGSLSVFFITVSPSLGRLGLIKYSLLVLMLLSSCEYPNLCNLLRFNASVPVARFLG